MDNTGAARDIYIRYKKGKLWLEEDGGPPDIELEDYVPINFNLTKDEFHSEATISEVVIFISRAHKDSKTNGKSWSKTSQAKQPYSYLKFAPYIAGGTGAVQVANASRAHEDISVYYAIKINNGGPGLDLDPEMIIKKKKDRG
ncbi:MAG: hypothetical protein QNL91_12790 [Candidatus Krumholzibacteria bacterium]|nr:hypothetical protein [Candidatus Krumholzibacteria bacterium]